MRYKTTKKVILVCISLICLTALGISGLFGVRLLMGAGGGGIAELTQKATAPRYMDSQALMQALEVKSGAIVSAVRLQEWFETEGEFDADKQFNIWMELSNAHGITPGQKELNYRLGDLMSWGKESNEIQDYLYSVRQPADGQEKEFEELYVPLEYKNLEAYVEKNGGDIQQCRYAVALAVSEIQASVPDYYQYSETYSPEHTNLIYEATNLTTNQTFSNRGTKTANYIVEQMHNNYKLKIGLDETFSVKNDEWFYANQQYNDLMPYRRPILFLLLASLAGSVVSILWLTVLSGHGSDKEGICLLHIDKIPTEAAIAGWGLIGYYIAKILQAAFSGVSDSARVSRVEVLMIGAACFAAAAAFMTGYLSLVRIVKSRRFIKNSFCYKALRGYKVIIRSTKITGRVLVIFGIYLLVNFILIQGYWMGGVGTLLFLGINGFVAYVLYKDAMMKQQILDGIQVIADGNLEYQIPAETLKGSKQEFAEAVNRIGNGLHHAVDASLKNERMKTDLITNVSHDIKTPLTSIVNYVDLLKRENIEDEKIKGYIAVLDQKSQRLKQLTEDLVEASKISSGNIALERIRMDFNELLQQTLGEFEDKFADRKLELVVRRPETPVIIEADGRRIWRVIENIFHNAVKYAMPLTRVYVELCTLDDNMKLTVKNVSEHPLNISADELTERFIRGDVSRSTEGSGLGLSIAKNLVVLQQGTFDIFLDGDFFRVTISFPLQAHETGL